MKTDFENRSINYVAQGNYQLPCVTAKESAHIGKAVPLPCGHRGTGTNNVFAPCQITCRKRKCYRKTES